MECVEYSRNKMCHLVWEEKFVKKCTEGPVDRRDCVTRGEKGRE